MELQYFLDCIPNALFIVRPISDKDFEYVYVNKAFCLLIGRDKEELVGKTYSTFFDSGEECWFKAFVQTVKTNRISYFEADSNVIKKQLFAQLFPVEEDCCGCMIHHFEEVSVKIKFLQEQATLLQHAYKDDLTGFYNHNSLKEFAKTLKENQNIGIAFLDLYNLKITNNLYGHHTGNLKIKELATLMQKHFKRYTLFRIGGDEFLAIGLNSKANVFLKTCENVKKQLEKNHLATIGYAYFETLKNLNEGIKLCENEMNQHKLKLDAEGSIR